MYVLGIETSCDETALSVVQDGRFVLSNEVVSSLRFHAKYGGIIPEIASRMQLEVITQLCASAIEKAGISLKDIGLIAVTDEPGLRGSLLVGTAFASGLSLSLNKPLIGVNHIFGHIYANFLNGRDIKLPLAALVVSGGHTNLFYMKDFNKIDSLGQTQDDACGEAFDKTAKILGLGYPGGPFIEKIAAKGGSKKIKFCCSGTKHPLNFSFSGIKTAVLYYAQKHKLLQAKRWLIADAAASFQEACFDAIVKKSLLACELKKAKRLAVGGGVAINNRLRQKLLSACAEKNISCYFPSRDLCMDNAAMIAGLGYQLYKKGGLNAH